MRYHEWLVKKQSNLFYKFTNEQPISKSELTVYLYRHRRNVKKTCYRHSPVNR